MTDPKKISEREKSELSKNDELISLIMKHDRDPEMPRRIEHTIYFLNHRDRDSFLDASRNIGYYSVPITHSEQGGNSFRAIVSKEGTPGRTTIDKMTLEILRLAIRFKGEYDGLEVELLK